MGSLVLVELVLAASHTLEAGEVSLYSQQMEVAVEIINNAALCFILSIFVCAHCPVFIPETRSMPLEQYWMNLWANNAPLCFALIYQIKFSPAQSLFYNARWRLLVKGAYLCAFTLLELLAAIFNTYYHNLGRVVHLSGMGGLVRLVQLQQVVRGGGAAEVDTLMSRYWQFCS